MALINRKILENKYEIIHVIKKGGFGIVYYGIDTQLNKPVAIKEIAPTLMEDPKYLDMFHEEALNIAKLSHNNIVHIYEFSKSSDGRLYIIMEYIDGKDLEKIIRAAKKIGERIPQNLAVYLIAETCAALDYAHNRRDAFTNKPLNLVHQDISPSNIMISNYGGVKLIDFGIAFVKRHQIKDKKDRKLRGKIPYMSPEQLLVGNHPDHRSDLFSLGLVLYETLTGERLFTSQEDIISAGKNHKWIKRKLKNSRLPSQLEKTLVRALETDISQRYQSANHMYIDLLQYLIACNETGELMDSLSDFTDKTFQRLQAGKKSMSSEIRRLQNLPTDDAQDLVPNRWGKESMDDDIQNNTFGFSEPDHSKTLQDVPRNKAEHDDAEDNDDDIMTVIDVIRISARNHKKRLFQTFFGLAFIALLFSVFDTMNGWTPVGMRLYDWLFPPAIKVVTVPENATLSLDSRHIAGQTPIAIERIAPGIHKLELSLEGYTPIVKSLFVPREGAVRIQGEQTRGDERSYLFRFNAQVAIDSNPQGADVFINDIRYNQQTPCAFDWEVGKPLSLQLQLNGFAKLSGYSLNTLEKYDTVEDRRFWQMQVINNSHLKYSIKGTFKKDIRFKTVPNGVEIYDLKTNSLLGISDNQTQIGLMAGEHKLEFRKRNFIPKKLTIEINGDFDEDIQVALLRKVQFTATDKLEKSERDIAAEIVYLKRGTGNILTQRKTTPFEMTLPGYRYTVKFQKPGYYHSEITIPPEALKVHVAMEPLRSLVECRVIDGITDQPISGAKIFYHVLDKPQPSRIFFDQTDRFGEGFGELPEGEYSFTVDTPGYGVLNKVVATRSGVNQTITFKLFLSN
ncbi:MAG: protein kinase [bacterium]